MTRLLVGVDGSEASARAVAFAIELAAELDLSIVAAHVIPWSPYSFTTSDENEHRASQKVKEIAAAQEQIIDPAMAQIALSSISADSFITHGHPVESMVELATERDVRHIVVGRTGDSRIKQVLFGSLPSQLIVHAPVPVTVVP